MSTTDQKTYKASQGVFSIWQGMTFLNWLRLLSSGPPMHWTQTPRLVLTTALSMSNSFWGAVESLIFGGKIARTELAGPPVFILGHWRSGTTLLQTLMACDPRFTTSNLYQVLAPQHFLLSEGLVTSTTGWLVPKTRPMDNMETSWGSPQEDETALMHLSMVSPYLMLAYQGQPERYRRFLDLRDVTPQELAAWKRALVTFMKKLTIRTGKRIMLKSPSHSYRVRLLKEMFPDAKFVNILRHPYLVYKSTLHLRTVLLTENALGKPVFDRMEEDALWFYRHLFDVYEEERQLLGPHELHELKFEDLEADPLGEMKKVYDTLELGGWEAVEPGVQKYVDAHREYKKNKYQLDETTKRRVYEAWQPAFEKYGYESDLPEEQPARVA